MDMKLRDKVAIVTGASYGIGEGIAKALAQEGVKMSICARGEEKLNNLAKELEGMGVEVLPVKADVTKVEDIEGMVKRTLDKFGRIDILVNNAGGMVRGLFMQADRESWQKGIDLNLFSTIHFSQLVVPSMRERKWGRIISISSVWGRQPGKMAIYNMVKSAIISLTKTLSTELAADNILVNAVCPGGIISPAWIETAEILAKKRGTTWQEEINKLGEKWAPLRRFGNTDEVGDLVVFLASERASYITGVSIPIDGGQTQSAF